MTQKDVYLQTEMGGRLRQSERVVSIGCHFYRGNTDPPQKILRKSSRIGAILSVQHMTVGWLISSHNIRSVVVVCSLA